MKRLAFLFFALASLAFLPPALAREAMDSVSLHQLPPEARKTVALIHQGGPYPYKRDGVVFSNREARLPKQKRGYYH